MSPTPQLLRIFLQQDIGTLRAMRDSAFEMTTSEEGILINSSVNGTAFTVEFGAKMTPKEVLILAQMALDAKVRGFSRPITRSIGLFN